MSLDLNELSRKLKESLKNITDEELIEYFPPDTKPKGWLSIEDHLPMMFAMDIMQGFSIFKVKDGNNEEFDSAVSDHNLWYYEAKKQGITHWFND